MIDAKTQALLKSLFAKDADGKVCVRLVQAEVEPTDLKNAINTQSNKSLSQLIEAAIVMDDNDNPALRIVPVNYGCTLDEHKKKKVVVSNKAVKELQETAIAASAKRLKKRQDLQEALVKAKE